MILVDTSAWVEFLRGTGSETALRLRDRDEELAICDPVRLEVLAGARDDRHLASLQRLLDRATTLPTEPARYAVAGELYRTCRRRGRTVRSLFDCLIAAIAIAADIPVLHSDRDFDTLVTMTALCAA